MSTVPSLIDLNSPPGRAKVPPGWNVNPVQGIFPDTPQTVLQCLTQIRAVRKLKIEAVEWAISRHRRERELDLPTTLTDDERRALQIYIQALCDFPQTLSLDHVIATGNVVTGLPWPVLPRRLEALLRPSI